jgi:hypothetical protein
MRAIVCCGVGAWHPDGVRRLEKSLENNFDGKFYGFTKFPPNSRDHISSPYGFKVHAIEYALQQGATQIIWLDASAWAITNTDEIFAIIKEKGYYFWQCGFTADQLCHDKCLNYFNITRDEAQQMTCIAGGGFGLNFETEIAREYFARLKNAEAADMFVGSWTHDNQSEDKRFLFYRHDQSCGSIIANQLNMEIDFPNKYFAYWAQDMNETVTFAFRGM